MKQRWSIQKIFSPLGKISLIAILWLGGVYAFNVINKTNIFNHSVTTEVSADGAINIWWPTQGAHVSDTQTLKAQVQDKDVSEYSMTWSVDGGQQNQMYDSATDYPHKEAIVNLSTWTWKGAGPYKLTFTALDKSNTQLGQTTIDIFTPEPAQNPTTVEAATSTIQAASTIPGVTSVNVASVLSAVTGIKSASAESTTQPQTQVQPRKMSVWWPTYGASLQGTQQFKARIDTMFVETYKLYWQVDGGQLNEMNNASDHKESSVDVSGWNWRTNGQYKITFVAKDLNGNTLATTDELISVSGANTSSQSAALVSQTAVQISDVAVQNTANTNKTVSTLQTLVKEVLPAVTNNSGSNVFSGQKLYVNPYSDAKKVADQWRSSRPQDAFQIDKIAQGSEAVWLGGWNSDISGFVKNKVSEIKNQGALPVFVAYNIPNRDCGQYSAGGVGGADEYRAWIRNIANAIGDNKAAILLEPDALTLTDCLGNNTQARYDLLKDAVAILKSKAHIGVYIDAGHPDWLSTTEIASRLQKAGIAQADGFSLNISNFYTTQDNSSYGQQISEKVGGKHFVIDTSRNGTGPTSDKQWCNPKGVALGARPTTSTGYGLVDAFLWVKGPGGSDGNCNGGPNAGEWWPDYALDIARRSAN